MVNGVAWEGDDEFISKVRQGAWKLTPIISKKDPRSPVILEHLLTLESALDMDNTFDAAIWVVTLICFWACCRLGELTVNSINLFDPSKHVSRSVVIRFRNNVQNGQSSESIHFHIPWTKSTKEKGADISASASSSLCVAKALRNHLRVNSGAPTGSHLFAFCTADGSFVPLTKSWFMECCHEIWLQFSLLLPSDHSFCIGGTTELLLAGVPPEVVAAIGCWKSLAFLLYWRKIEEILPKAVSKSYVKTCIAEVSADFERFRVANHIPAIAPRV